MKKPDYFLLFLLNAVIGFTFMGMLLTFIGLSFPHMPEPWKVVLTVIGYVLLISGVAICILMMVILGRSIAEDEKKEAKATPPSNKKAGY